MYGYGTRYVFSPLEAAHMRAIEGWAGLLAFLLGFSWALAAIDTVVVGLGTYWN